MNKKEFKELAHSQKMECSFDAEGDVCISPMLFNEEGKRQLTYRPDPGEFIAPYEAALKLITPEMEQLIETENWSNFERQGRTNREIAASRLISEHGWGAPLKSLERR